MRALLTCLFLACAGPALAMNWEGHDDWMAELDPALVYRDALPQALAPPRPPCSAGRSQDIRNPYEQIPLNEPDCRAFKEGRENER